MSHPEGWWTHRDGTPFPDHTDLRCRLERESHRRCVTWNVGVIVVHSRERAHVTFGKIVVAHREAASPSQGGDRSCRGRIGCSCVAIPFLTALHSPVVWLFSSQAEDMADIVTRSHCRPYGRTALVHWTPLR